MRPPPQTRTEGREAANWRVVMQRHKQEQAQGQGLAIKCRLRVTATPCRAQGHQRNSCRIHVTGTPNTAPALASSTPFAATTSPCSGWSWQCHPARRGATPRSAHAACGSARCCASCCCPASSAHPRLQRGSQKHSQQQGRLAAKRGSPAMASPHAHRAAPGSGWPPAAAAGAPAPLPLR